MVGAAQTNRVSIGIDVNPLATFVAQVKLDPLSSKQLEKIKEFTNSFDNLIKSHAPWDKPALKIADKVFESEILDTILRLRSLLESGFERDRQIRDFLFLAWLAILEEVGSYFKEGNGIKYRNKKRSKNGYIRRKEGVWQLERFGSNQRAYVVNAYTKQLSKMISDSSLWSQGNWEEQRVITGDSLNFTNLLVDDDFDSIIFSPPYANRFDYFEAQKVELWFGNFVNSYKDLSDLRKISIRSHLGANLSRPISIELEYLEQLIDQMDRQSSSWRMRVPDALRGYFDDIYQILIQCKSVINKGKCFIVVGNSAFAGVIIPTDSLIAQLGIMAGFNSCELRVVRHLTVAPQQRNVLRGLESYMRETIVVLE